jgi:hypothetical protein
MDMEKMLKHMAWANREILGKVAEMPDAALDSYLLNPEWTVREITRHIASSATWYGWRLLDKTHFTDEDRAAWQRKLDLTEVQPATAKDVLISIAYLKDADAELLAASRLPEGDTERDRAPCPTRCCARSSRLFGYQSRRLRSLELRRHNWRISKAPPDNRRGFAFLIFS